MRDMSRQGWLDADVMLAALAVLPAAANATRTACCGPWGAGGQIAVSADGLNVYVADSQATLALRRDPVSGALSLIDSYDGGGALVELSPDGRHVYVSGGG